MPERPMEELERFAKPPIVEVACGIGFERVPDLDPVFIGGYWAQDSVRRRFPHRAVHPAIEEPKPGEPAFSVTDGSPPQRAWLVSADSAFVVQLQADRFFLNWRWVGAEYPCFKGIHGGDPGVLERALEEFESISSYVERMIGRGLEPRRVDVLKVDMLNEGTHWRDPADAVVMAPALGHVLQVGPFRHPAFAIQVVEDVAGARVRLTSQRLGQEPSRQIRLETQVVRVLGESESVREGLVAAERLADAVFAGVIPKDQRDLRFKDGQ